MHILCIFIYTEIVLPSIYIENILLYKLAYILNMINKYKINKSYVYFYLP